MANACVGTGIIAQFGIVLLVILVWVSVFTKPLILFSGHPLAQSLGILFLIQSVLSLQPTHTPEQKRIGQKFHASLNLLAFLSLLSGIIVIEYNKVVNGLPHFHSVHAYLGVSASIVLLLQYLVGFTMFLTPALYGGVDNAKAVWKYHRLSGYLVLVLLLVTVCSAVETDFNKSTLKLQLWSVILLSLLVLVGVIPRIQLFKFGYRRTSQ